MISSVSLWSRRSRVLSVFFAAVALLAGPLAASAAESNLVTSIAQLFALPSEELTHNRPVQIDATVLCFDRVWHQLYIYSESNTMYLDPGSWSPVLKPGDHVRLQAETALPKAGVPLTNAQIAVTGHGRLPRAPLIDLKDWAVHLTKWVDITGEVRVAERSRGRLGLVIKNDNLECQAFVMGTSPSRALCQTYIGAKVRIRGIARNNKLPDGTMGMDLLCPGMQQLQTLARAPELPSEIPVTSIDGLLSRELGPWTNSPVHLNGQVVGSAPGDSLVFKDPTGVLLVKPRQMTVVEPGTRIDLWGYLLADGDDAVIIDAWFEPTFPVTPLVVAEAAATNVSHTVATNVSQLASFGRTTLKAGVPVRIEGTVTYSDPVWQLAFVFDGRLSICAELKDTNITVGQAVELSGFAVPGGVNPMVKPAAFSLRGSGKLPTPLLTDLDELADGHLDAQWIELRGVIRHAHVDNKHLHLTLVTRKGSFHAIIPNYAEDQPPVRLLGSRVALYGACQSDLNTRSQIAGITICVPSLDHIHLISPPEPNPFARPAVPIAAVATGNSRAAQDHRFKIAGVVTAKIPGENLFVQDASGGIRVRTDDEQMAKLEIGDAVEVVGYAAMGDFSPHLEDPEIRVTGKTDVPLPRETSAERILLDATNDACLVQVEGTLLQPISRSARPRLVMQQGPLIFAAQIVQNPLLPNTASLRPGSVLRLTGVCSIQAAADQTPQSFRLLLPKSGSVELLKAAPLLSTRQLSIMAGLLGFFGLAALAWVSSLRQVVHARTAELAASRSNLERQYEQSRAFAELGRRLNAAGSPREAAAIVFDVADQLLKWDAAICYLYSPEDNLAYHVLNYDLIDGQRAEGIAIRDGLPPSEIFRKVIDEGGQLVLRDLNPGAPIPGGIPFGNQGRFSASLLFVPIRNGKKVTGLLTIQSYAAKAYTQQSLEILQAMADHCGGAFERIRSQHAERTAQSALQAAEAKYRGIFENCLEGIFQSSAEGKLTMVNPALAHILGYASPEELVREISGKEQQLYAVPARREELYRRLQSEGAVTGFESEAWRKDGSRVWLSENVRMVPDADGITHIEGVVADISPRKQAELALRASEERFREFAEHLDDVFWTNDPVTRQILYVSPAYEKIWGRTCQSLYDAPATWLEAVHPNDRGRVREANAASQSTGSYDVEYRIVRPDGQVRHVRDRSIPIRDESGQIRRIIGVARDITESAQLAEQLRQSQKLEAIGRLAGGVAHDFNNILSAMVMQIELLELENDLSPDTRIGLVEIRKAADRAANLTRQLLLFSRRQVMQPRDLNLNDLVTGLAKMLQRIIGEDVHLQLNLNSAPPFTRADPGMLEQVILNLSVNARDAMPDGGRLLIETGERIVDEETARLNPDAVAGRHACLSVSDTGTGIPAEILPHIFEPFFTTKEPGKGTGLGLATVFGIVKQHRGWLTVSNQATGGVRFDIYLPAFSAKPVEEEAPVPVSPRGGKETILLAEDDATVRGMLRVVLERHGYKILEAANGVDALTLWRQHQSEVQLLFTDLVMPEGITGKQLARQMCIERPRLKVIFASGYSPDIAGKELRLENGENYLQKPFNQFQLLETVRRSLDA